MLQAAFEYLGYQLMKRRKWLRTRNEELKELMDRNKQTYKIDLQTKNTTLHRLYENER
jgi:hypothetical protein